MIIPVLLLASSALAAGPILTVDDIVALLEAGVGESVILKQLSLTTTRLTLTVEGLIQLKVAGASDSLLEALVSQPAGTAPEPEPIPVPREVVEGGVQHPFRVYSAVSDRGETVVHITNLDESGRRIGGELEPASFPNVMQPSRETPPDPRRDDEYDAYDEGERSHDDDGQGRVVVNVYPQDPQAGAAVAQDPYRSDYDDPYWRYAPAYYGQPHSYHRFHTPTCGHFYYGRPYGYGYSGYPGVPYYGRHWPHHKGYGIHGGYGYARHGTGVPYLGSIRTAPYSYSSAAARNQRAFGRR